MKKKVIIGLTILMALVLMAPAAFAKSFTIGVVIPYEIGWFAAFHQGFEKVANAQGAKIVWAYHNYKADEETKAVENLIAQGVDVINLTATGEAGAEYACKLANEAKIPIQITESGSGKGQPFANIDFNWADVYVVVANNLRKDLKGDLNVIWLQGFLGTPPVEMGIKGFKDQVTKLKGVKLAAPVQDGKYATEPSIGITKTLVESGTKFNVAIGACQEITAGIVQGLNEENVPRKDVTIVTVNGGPMDIDGMQKGQIDYCLSLSPGLHGMICAANLLAYMNKQTYQKKTFSPIVWTSAADWQKKLIPWDVDEKWFPVVDAFVKSGKYKPELKKM